MSALIADVRFGLRLLAKSPAFTFAVVALLAAGIGSNTLIFSAVDALLLRPLPVQHPENLVRLVEVHPNEFLTWDLPYSFCQTVAAKAVSLSDVLCQGEADLPMREDSGTGRVHIHAVSPNFFSSLGATAALGRVLTAADERTAAPVAVLSDAFWSRHFARDPGVVGRVLSLDDRAVTVVGVSEPGFNGLSVESSPDLRIPAASLPDRSHLSGQIFGRLRAGIPLAAASREVDSLFGDYEAALERMFPGRSSTPVPLQSHLRLESAAHGISLLRSQFERGLQISMAGVALLLLMACANVAGLLLARSAARQSEIGIRMAIGAAPGRIVRQLFTEGLLLALAGGVAGGLLAWAGLPLVRRALPALRDRAAVLHPPTAVITLDWRVLLFAAGATLLTAVLFALSPAWRAMRTDVASVLRGSRTVTGRLFARHAIVAAQVALSTVILMGSALLVQTLYRMRSMDAGFDRDHVVTFTIDPSLHHYKPAQASALSARLLEQAAALPGVRGAAIASIGLMRGTGIKATVAPAGTRVFPSDFLNSSLNDVTPGYFDVMGMKILAGRDLTWFDRPAAPAPAVVNRAFVARFFPGKDAIGQTFGYAGPGGIAQPANRVVGIVSDAHYRSLRELIPPTVYTAAERLDSGFILHLRTAAKPDALIEPVRKLVASLDPDLPIVEARTLHDEVEDSLWQERLLAWLSAAFGGIAALLAGIGLYGALDYAVESRRREIAVRVAMGARPPQVAGLLGRTVALLVAAGVAAGIAAYSAAATPMARVLYGVRAWEPQALIAVAVFLMALAAAASLPAIRRAIRTDPASALRAE